MFSNVGFSCQKTQLKCAQPPPFTVVIAPPMARHRTQLSMSDKKRVKSNTSHVTRHTSHVTRHNSISVDGTHGSLLRLLLHSMQKNSSSSPGTSKMLAHLFPHGHEKQQQQQQH